MAERKTTYKDSTIKKQVREFLFSFFIDRQLDKIVGLGGPDITDYIKFCESKGYVDFEIFEILNMLVGYRLSYLHLKQLI